MIGGYRPSAFGGHVAVINALEELVEKDVGRDIIIMDGMRKRRHEVVYDEIDVISEENAKSAIDVAKRLIDSLASMIPD